MGNKRSGAQRNGDEKSTGNAEIAVYDYLVRLLSGYGVQRWCAVRVSKRYCGLGLSSESKEADDPGPWELGLKSVKRLWVSPGHGKTGAALAPLPGTGTRGRGGEFKDRNSKYKE